MIRDKDKKILILAAIMIAAVLLGHLLLKYSRSIYPYGTVSAEEIANVKIEVLEQRTTIDLNEEEKKRFVSIINDVVIYGTGDNVYEEMEGTWPPEIFIVEFVNGDKAEIEPANPYFVIDGLGYSCDYDACDKLHKFFNEIVDYYVS